MSDSLPAPEPGDLRPTGRPNARLRQTVWDMVRSLALVILAVVVIMLLTWRPQPDPVRVVDVMPTLLQARIEAPYDVVYPEGLDQSWRPTSVRWQVTEPSEPEPAWHVGFVTPDDNYVQLGQSDTDNPDFLVEQTGGAEVRVLGGEWQRYETPAARSLVKIFDGSTVVLSGTATWEELQQIAGLLSSQGLPTTPALTTPSLPAP